MSAYLWIALGSALGGTARYAVSFLFAGWVGTAFPWGTLIINVTGSWLIGFFNTLTAAEGRLFVPVRIRQFFMIGICGGYTTFSAFSFETVSLAGRGAWEAAGAYVALSLVFCLLAVWLGHMMASSINRLRA